MIDHLDILESCAPHPVDQAVTGGNKIDIAGLGITVLGKQSDRTVSRYRQGFDDGKSANPQGSKQTFENRYRAAVVVDDGWVLGGGNKLFLLQLLLELACEADITGRMFLLDVDPLIMSPETKLVVEFSCRELQN